MQSEINKYNERYINTKKENSSPKIGEVPRRGEGVFTTEGYNRIVN